MKLNTRKSHQRARQFNIGIIGFGDAGAMHARTWHKIPGVRLAAIAEPQRARRLDALRRYGKNGLRVFATSEDMLAKLPLDIVVVATQAPLHARSTIAALKAGAHVICEKPIALSLAESDRMVAEAVRAKVKLAVHHQTVFSKAFARATTMIERGAIGKFYFMEAWAKGRPAAYDLMEVGGHVLHLMRHFGGEVEWVFGHAMNRGQDIRTSDGVPIERLWPQGERLGKGAGDYLFGYYRFAKGVTGILRLKTTPMRSNEYLTTEFHGTKGRIRLHHTATGRLFFKPTPYDDFKTARWQEVDPKLWDDDITWAGPMKRFAEDFLDAVRNHRKPKVSGEDGRAALEMALGIYASHLAGRPLPLPLRNRKHPFA